MLECSGKGIAKPQSSGVTNCCLARLGADRKSADRPRHLGMGGCEGVIKTDSPDEKCEAEASHIIV